MDSKQFKIFIDFDGTITKQDVGDAIFQTFGEREKVDAIISPVSPTPPWKLGEKVDDPLKMYLSDAYTVIANLAGIPGLAVPSGFIQHQTFGAG